MTTIRTTRHTGWHEQQPKAACRPMCACITNGNVKPQGDNTADLPL